MSNIKDTCHSKGKLYVPLEFWFNKNSGLMFNDHQVQYIPVTVDIKFDKPIDLITIDTKSEVDCEDIKIIIEI